MAVKTIAPWGELKQIDNNLKAYGQNIARFAQLFERISQRRRKLLPEIVKKLQENTLTAEDRKNYSVLICDKAGMLNKIYQENIPGVRQNLAALLEKIMAPEFLKKLEEESAENPKRIQKAYKEYIATLNNLFAKKNIIDRFMSIMQETINEEKKAILESKTPEEMTERLTSVKKGFETVLAEATGRFRSMNTTVWDREAMVDINIGKLGAGLLAGGVGINVVLGLAGLPIQLGAIGGLVMVGGFWLVAYELLLK